MRQMAILVHYLPSGMNSPRTIRYPELAQAPAPAIIGEGLQSAFENCQKMCGG
jgi:hypothetical protein